MYTIYESIGKSVVVPYCGSKTINVRLTVSPDATSGAQQPSVADAAPQPAATTAPSVFQRRYKYRSRKLIPTDDEPSTAAATTAPTAPATAPAEPQLIDLRVPPTTPVVSSPAAHTARPLAAIDNRHSAPSTPGRVATTPTIIIRNDCHAVDNVYESIPMVSAAAAAAMQRLQEEHETQQHEAIGGNYSCRECSSQCPLLDQSVSTAAAAAAASAPLKLRKLMRRSRSKKPKAGHHHLHRQPQQQQQPEPQQQQQQVPMRARSLSVGNENCYRSSARSADAATRGGGGAQAAGGGSKGGEGGEECLNNLRRNDLIDIIRESMEKNRMCFQSNG